MRTALGPVPAPAEIAAVVAGIPKAPPPSQPAGQQSGPQQSPGGDTGGMIIVEVEVVNGKLVVNLDNLDGLSTYLTAIIVEPADQPSNFDLGGEVGDYYQNDRARLAETNSRIDEQIGALLSEIATAAGPQQIAQALGIDQAPAEPNTLASAN